MELRVLPAGQVGVVVPQKEGTPAPIFGRFSTSVRSHTWTQMNADVAPEIICFYLRSSAVPAFLRYNALMLPRLLLSVVLAAAVAGAQGRTTPPPMRPSPGLEMEKPPDATPSLNSPAKLLKYQHEEIKKDMEKLARLVEEVQEELEKAGENVLPLNTLKKLEDVEKLSRKVRSRLKQ